jgi:hypothetical protein
MTGLPAPDVTNFPLPLPASAVRTLPAGTIFGRIYESGGAHPSRWDFRRFGPTQSRFDHHPSQRVTGTGSRGRCPRLQPWGGVKP